VPGLAAELALPEPRAARAGFDRAARSFASASFIHDEARRRLLDRLASFRVGTGVFADLGAGLGQGAAALARQYPEARVLAFDSSLAMLRQAPTDGFARLGAEIGRLPLPDRSVALLFANLVLPWSRPEALFAEARRVLKDDGLIVFSTLGPDTLKELRRAWLRADDAIHVHAFWDVQTLGDLAVRAGLEEPVLDVDRIRVSYGGLSGAIRDLRACGATNTASGRRRGLTGRGRWQRFVDALWREQGAGDQRRLQLTVELIFGHAFGARAQSQSVSGGEVIVPLGAIGRRPGAEPPG
jgi:malonyl-CoA O-methyltransferase